MSAIGTIRRCALLLTAGWLLAACDGSGASMPTIAPVIVSQTVAPSPPTQATSGARDTASTTPTSAAVTQTATRSAIRAVSATPSVDCDNAALTALVARFLDAYNAGDVARLLAFFPARDATRGHLVPGEETYFQRYWDVRKTSLRDEDGFAAYARAELPPYWALRHAQQERLQLRRFQYCDRNWDGNLAFVFELTRQADDLAMHSVVGKGEIDDARGTIVIWSMGPQEQPAATPARPSGVPAPPTPAP